MEINLFSSLQKQYQQRLTFAELLKHPFAIRSEAEEVDMAAYVTDILENFQPKQEEKNS